MNFQDTDTATRQLLTCAHCNLLMATQRCMHLACGHFICAPCLSLVTAVACIVCHAPIAKDAAIDCTPLVGHMCRTLYPTEVAALVDAQDAAAQAPRPVRIKPEPGTVELFPPLTNASSSEDAFLRDLILRQMSTRVENGLIPNAGCAYIEPLRKELRRVKHANQVTLCNCRPRPLVCVPRMYDGVFLYKCPMWTPDGRYTACNFYKHFLPC